MLNPPCVLFMCHIQNLTEFSFYIYLEKNLPCVGFLYLSSSTELIWTLGESCHSSGCHLHLLSRVAGWVLQNYGHFAQHLHPELKYRAKEPIDKEVDVPSHFHPCRRLYVTSVLASFSPWSASVFSISDTEANICPSASPVSKPCCSNWLTVSSTADWRVSTDELELLFHTLRNIKGQTDSKFSFYMMKPCFFFFSPFYWHNGSGRTPTWVRMVVLALSYSFFTVTTIDRL